MLRFDIEKSCPRAIMNGLWLAIQKENLRSAYHYLSNNGIQCHLGGNHVAILRNKERIAIITEEISCQP